MDVENLPLPPIIVDMITKLQRPGASEFEQENLAQTLEIIAKACTTASGRFRDKQAKASMITPRRGNRRARV
jgi:hypothetical protein